jgi:hypothetical protein
VVGNYLSRIPVRRSTSTAGSDRQERRCTIMKARPYCSEKKATFFFALM